MARKGYFTCTVLPEYASDRKRQFSTNPKKSKYIMDFNRDGQQFRIPFPDEVEKMTAYVKVEKRSADAMPAAFVIVEYKNGEVLLYDYAVTYYDRNLRVRYVYGGLSNGERGCIRHNHHNDQDWDAPYMEIYGDPAKDLTVEYMRLVFSRALGIANANHLLDVPGYQTLHV